MNPYDATIGTVQERAQKECPLPSWLKWCASQFRIIHFYYRWRKMALFERKAMSEPSKAHPALLAAVVPVLEIAKPVEYAVKVALIAKCADDLFDQYRKLSMEFKKLREAFNWQYPIYYYTPWQESCKGSFNVLSPSMELVWYNQIVDSLLQLEKIIFCACRVLGQLFELAMCQYEIYLLFGEKSTEAKILALTELFGKLDEYREQTCSNLNFLAHELTREGSLGSQILGKIGIADSEKALRDLKTKVRALTNSDTAQSLAEATEVSLNSFYSPGKRSLEFTPLHRDYQGRGPSTLRKGAYPPLGRAADARLYPSTFPTFEGSR